MDYRIWMSFLNQIRSVVLTELRAFLSLLHQVSKRGLEVCDLCLQMSTPGIDLV